MPFPSVGLLLTSQLHNASQLSAWCLHFISSNYVVFKDKEEFSQLVGDNVDYINQHRWPPLSYEQAMEEESDESAEDSENSEGEEGSGSVGGGDGGEGGEGKSSGGVEKRNLRRGRKGSVVGQKRRTRNKAAAAAVTDGRGRTNNRCRVM
jgi:hypothetical protein